MWTRAEGFWLRFDAGLWDELLERDRRASTGGRPSTATPRSPPSPASTGPGCSPTGAKSQRRSSSPMLSRRSLGRSRISRSWRRRSSCAVVSHAAAGDRARALALVDEFDAATREGPSEYRELYAAGGRACADRCGRDGARRAHRRRAPGACAEHAPCGRDRAGRCSPRRGATWMRLPQDSARPLPDGKPGGAGSSRGTRRQVWLDRSRRWARSARRPLLRTRLTRSSPHSACRPARTAKALDRGALHSR